MAPLKSVRVEYFAAFREAAGACSEAIRSTAVTAAQLYDEVAALHGFPFNRATLGVALNDALVPWSAEIHDGDRVAFLAPFAGG